MWIVKRCCQAPIPDFIFVLILFYITVSFNFIWLTTTEQRILKNQQMKSKQMREKSKVSPRH